MIIDKIDDVADGFETVRVVLRYGNAALVLESHKKLHDVYRICAEIVNDVAFSAYGRYGNTELFADNRNHFRIRIHFSSECETAFTAVLLILSHRKIFVKFL